jgi:SAM-dependent methyltransferase
VADPNPWEGFAHSDPYFYIATDFETMRGAPDAVDRFYEAGKPITEALLGEVASLLPGRSLAVEIGCGVGRLLLAHAGHFENLRGVDIAPRMLSLLEARALETGMEQVQGFLPADGWDLPAGSADYVYSALAFQHIEDAAVIASYVSRIGRALRSGGIAQLHFDTRHRGVLYRARAFVPDRLLGRTQRRGIRRVRRDPEWIRHEIRAAGLEILREREPASADHWFVLRRG